MLFDASEASYSLDPMAAESFSCRLLSGLAEEWDAKAILRARIRNEGILFLRKVKGDALAINVAGAEHNVDVLAPLIHKATVADGELHLCTVPDFEKQPPVPVKRRAYMILCFSRPLPLFFSVQ